MGLGKLDLERSGVDMDLYHKLKKRLHAARQGPVANTPYKLNDAVKLGLKQLITDAVDRGDDYVLLANPELVSNTQGMPLDAARKMYGEVVPNVVNEMLKPHKAKAEMMELPGHKGTKPSKLEFAAEHLGLSQDDARFADVDEIAKEYGWHKLQRSPPKVLGFKIPDSMKQQVKTKGFPMLQVVGPALGLSGYNAIQNAARPRYQQEA